MSRLLLNLPLAILYRNKFHEFRVSPTADIQLSRIRGGSGCSLTVSEESRVRAYIAFLKPNASVHVGARTFIGKSRIYAATEIVIEDDVLISWDVTIVDNNSHSVRYSERSRDVRDWSHGRKNWQHVKSNPVHIQSKAWIGFGTSILSGVTVGTGCVIGACSVVTADVPAWTVWAGNPARLIRELSTDER